MVRLLLYLILGLVEETATSLKPTTNETATNNTNPDQVTAMKDVNATPVN